MNSRRVWLLGFWVCLGAGPAVSPSLTGRVLLGFQGLTPASGMKVSSNGLNPTRTDDQGVFRLSLPPGSKPGTRIKIELVNAGHCILSPYNGEVVVPEDQGSALPVELRLLRSDSRQSNSEDCIARFIEAVARRPRELTRREEKPAPVEMPLELQVWAGRQGVSLTAEQARAELTRWLEEVKGQCQRARSPAAVRARSAAALRWRPNGRGYPRAHQGQARSASAKAPLRGRRLSASAAAGGLH